MLVRIFLLTVLAAVATANCGSSDPAYTGEIRVAAPNVQILYKVEGAYIRLRATLLSGAGWLGVGFSPSGGMVGANAVICQTSPAISAAEYSLGGYKGNMIQPVQGLAQQITCSAANGYTVLDFLYPIGQGPAPINLGAPVNLVVATGGTNGQLSYHSERVAIACTFQSC